MRLYIYIYVILKILKLFFQIYVLFYIVPFNQIFYKIIQIYKSNPLIFLFEKQSIFYIDISHHFEYLITCRC